jgi:amino acid transporter
MTYIATIGVNKFSELADFGGEFTLAATVIFIVMTLVGYFSGTPSATQFTAETVIREFSLKYFYTFSWLLFEGSGSEVAGTYIIQTENPKENLPKAMIIATIFIALSYILGSIDAFFKMLTDLSSLAVVIPYVVLIYACLVFIENNKDLFF